MNNTNKDLENKVQKVLAQISQSEGLPRIEIDGHFDPKPYWRTIIGNEQNIPHVRYVLNDYYEDSTYVTQAKVDYISFERKILEDLILESLRSSLESVQAVTQGDHKIWEECWDDWGGTHDGEPFKTKFLPLLLTLKKSKDQSAYSLKIKH